MCSPEHIAELLSGFCARSGKSTHQQFRHEHMQPYAALTVLLSSCQTSNNPRVIHVQALQCRIFACKRRCELKLRYGPTGQEHSSELLLPRTSKLSLLLDACYRAPNATQPSACQAVRVVSTCAVADPSIYAMLLPLLESMLWGNSAPDIQLTAAAGMYCMLGAGCSLCQHS